MLIPALAVAAVMAILCGLDRTAAGQFMICRPIVAAPVTGLLLGEGALGLQVGTMLELLWLGRLPVGAAIPPDDSQVAVGCTLLAAVASRQYGLSPQALAVGCLLIGMPFGKAGQFFDRLARLQNARLLTKAELALDAGQVGQLDRLHLRGLWHFVAASLATLTVVVAGGMLCLLLLVNYFSRPLVEAAPWLWLLFPAVGGASLFGGLKVPRGMWLFSGSFVFGLLFLAWL